MTLAVAEALTPQYTKPNYAIKRQDILLADCASSSLKR